MCRVCFVDLSELRYMQFTAETFACALLDYSFTFYDSVIEHINRMH